MFNLGFTHLLILGVIALVVIGPEQLPEMARKFAKLLNELRRAKDEIMAPMTEFQNNTQKLIQEAQEKANADISKLLEMRNKLDAEIKSQQTEQFKTAQQGFVPPSGVTSAPNPNNPTDAAAGGVNQHNSADTPASTPANPVNKNHNNG